MNALSVRSTSSGSATGLITDGTLAADPSQYDNVLHSGGPDGTRYTIWDLGAAYSVSEVGYDYHGAAGGGYADFSADGLAWSGQVGPFGAGASGSEAVLPFNIDGAPRGTGRYVRFRPATTGAGIATDETFVYVGGVRVGGPVVAAAPTFASAAVAASGTSLAVTLTVPGTPPVLPAAGVTGFVVRVAGVPAPLTAGTSAGAVVTLTLGQTVSAGQAVTVAYAPGNVTDSAGAPNALAAFPESAVANNSAQAAPATVSAQRRLFSTGTLAANWTDAGGNARTAAFATLQDISLEITFDRTNLYDAAQVSIFPVDSADSMGRVQLKASNATVSADTLQRLIAAALTGNLGAGTVTAALPKSVVLPAFQAVFTGTGTDGKAVAITFGVAKAKGDSLSGKVKDFWLQNFELDCYPDADGIIATFAFTN